LWNLETLKSRDPNCLQFDLEIARLAVPEMK
jgi:hypothetical protein